MLQSITANIKDLTEYTHYGVFIWELHAVCCITWMKITVHLKDCFTKKRNQPTVIHECDFLVLADCCPYVLCYIAAVLNNIIAAQLEAWSPEVPLKIYLTKFWKMWLHHPSFLDRRRASVVNQAPPVKTQVFQILIKAEHLQMSQHQISFFDQTGMKEMFFF